MIKKKLLTIMLSWCIGAAMLGGCGNSDPVSQKSEVGKDSAETEQKSGGQPKSETKPEDADPFGGYEEPIDISVLAFDTLKTACPEGVDFDNNPWKSLWESKGIRIEYKAIVADGEALQSKLNLLVASEDLPDSFNVGYSLYQELRDADLLEDLTDVYNTYASDDLKEQAYADGGKNMGLVTDKDGRIYGIAQPADYMDQGAVVAIRTDWMKQLNREAPRTIDELWDLARAFKENNMDGTCTIGIGATKEISGMLAMRYLINAYGGHAGMWYEEDGRLEYSLIQPRMKNALSKLHDRYAEGTLDQEYGSKGEAQLFEDAVAGKSGIVVCNMTAPFYLDNGLSLGQEWGYFPLYDSEGGYAPVEMAPGFSGAVVCRKGYEHPEAIIKMLNLFVKYGTEDPDTYGSNGINNLSYPFILSRVGANHANYMDYKYFAETGKDPEHPNPGYADCKATNLKYLDGDVESRILYTIFSEKDSTQAVLAEEMDGGGYVFSAFKGAPGEASVKYGGTLGTMADQMMTDIITGAQPADYFDEFVEMWKTNGGDEITEEVNDWFRSQR